MTIHFGLFTAERIPQSDEEREAIKDAPYIVEAHLVEVEDVPEVRIGDIPELPGDPQVLRLIRQFNAAERARSAIDRFLGFFKVLEDLYCTGNNTMGNLERSLELFDLANEILRTGHGVGRRQLTRDEHNAWLGKIVMARDQCAHLRSSQGFGVAPSDPLVRTEIAPLVEELRLVAFDAIRRKMAAPLTAAPTTQWMNEEIDEGQQPS